MLRERNLADKVTYHAILETQCELPDSRYVRIIDEVSDESLDFVLVDGLARSWCALAAIPKLRPGGLLVIDNANWYLPGPYPSRSPNSRNELGPAGPEWFEVSYALARWRCIWTSNGVTDTAMWVKPAG